MRIHPLACEVGWWNGDKLADWPDDDGRVFDDAKKEGSRHMGQTSSVDSLPFLRLRLARMRRLVYCIGAIGGVMTTLLTRVIVSPFYRSSWVSMPTSPMPTLAFGLACVRHARYISPPRSQTGSDEGSLPVADNAGELVSKPTSSPRFTRIVRLPSMM